MQPGPRGITERYESATHNHRGTPDRADLSSTSHSRSSPPVDTAVVLAAGAGTRLRSGEESPPKPLTQLLGRTLLERAVRTGLSAGVSRFVVVTGYQSRALEAPMRELQREHGVPVLPAHNPHWELGNGSSVLAAAPYVPGSFFLAMCDHVYHPGFLRRLAASDDGRRSLALAVDREWEAVSDLDEATKVRTQGQHITDIGKELAVFDAVDTGVFLCRPTLFAALRRAAIQGEHSLSGAVRILSAERDAHAVPVDGMFWQDVDTADDLAFAAERMRRARLVGDADPKPRVNATANRAHRTLSAWQGNAN